MQLCRNGGQNCDLKKQLEEQDWCSDAAAQKGATLVQRKETKTMDAPIVAAHHEGSTAFQGRSASDAGKLLRSMEDAGREVRLRRLKLDQSAARRPI